MDIVKLLVDNPLLLLFVVAGIGYPLGKIKLAGSSLGVSAVLFAGLAIGALNKDLKLPEIIYQIGLVLFVYTVGLQNGPGFFASLRNKGLRDNGTVAGLLIFAAALAILFYNLFNLKATLTVGMFAGSLTNTPALAASLEYLKGNAPADGLQQMLAEPVIGYSIAYPIGVIGVMLAIFICQRLWKINYTEEAEKLHEPGSSSERILSRTILVTNPAVCEKTIQQLTRETRLEVIFARVKRKEQLELATSESRLQAGDLVSVVGTVDGINKVTAFLGKSTPEKLELDRSGYDFRRIFVSNPKVVGRKLSDLNLPRTYGAVVTRVRRGDIEFLPHGDTVLELGDRVRVVTSADNIDTVTSFFGDSYKALSEVDVVTFSIGIAVGLLVGLIPIPVPGGVTIKLGSAAGPLIIALILGKIERTGPLVWTMPYSANITLRQIGLVLFLAGVGTRAGYPFVDTFTKGGGVLIFLGGAVITCLVAILGLFIGYKIYKIPMGRLIGMVAGVQTQPAVLGYGLEQAGNELPNLGYAAVYPTATIVKIILAQVILALLL